MDSETVQHFIKVESPLRFGYRSASIQVKQQIRSEAFQHLSDFFAETIQTEHLHTWLPGFIGISDFMTGFIVAFTIPVKSLFFRKTALKPVVTIFSGRDDVVILVESKMRKHRSSVLPHSERDHICHSEQRYLANTLDRSISNLLEDEFDLNQNISFTECFTKEFLVFPSPV